MGPVPLRALYSDQSMVDSHCQLLARIGGVAVLNRTSGSSVFVPNIVGNVYS